MYLVVLIFCCTILPLDLLLPTNFTNKGCVGSFRTWSTFFLKISSLCNWVADTWLITKILKATNLVFGDQKHFESPSVSTFLVTETCCLTSLRFRELNKHNRKVLVFGLPVRTIATLYGQRFVYTWPSHSYLVPFLLSLKKNPHTLTKCFYINNHVVYKLSLLTLQLLTRYSLVLGTGLSQIQVK